MGRLCSTGVRDGGRLLRAALLASTALVGCASFANAIDGTWNLNGDGSYNIDTNWSSGQVPGGTDTATFGVSNQNNVDTAAGARSVGGWTFNAGASIYTFTLGGGGVAFIGDGILVNGGSVTIGFFFAGGPLQFFGSSTAGSANIINRDSGSFSRSAIEFFHTSTAGSATITNNYFVGFRNASTAGSANITNNDTLQFTDSATAGSANITNNAGVQFFGSSTAGSATITNNSILQFLTNSTAGNAQLITNAGAATDFSTSVGPAGNGKLSAGSIAGAGSYVLGSRELTVGSNNLSTTVSGVISGDGGSLVKTGTGTLTLTGTNTYTGGTTINNGILQIGPGGSIMGNVVNNASLAFITGFNPVTFAGAISGSGVLTKNGVGTLTLNAAHSYTGATTVDFGGLIVNGSIASSSALNVNNGAFVGGTGVLPTTVINGGTLAPGTSVGTIRVNGNLTFNPGATYAVELGANGVDRTNVTGTASLAGTVAVRIEPTATLQRANTILSAGARSGTFANLTGLPAHLSGELAYTGSEVRLFLSANLPTNSLPANQQGVAKTLNDFFNGGGTLPSGFATLFGLTGASFTNALSQISAPAPTVASVSAKQTVTSFMSLSLSPYQSSAQFINARAFGPVQSTPLPQDVADAYAAIMPMRAQPANFGSRWSVWGQSYGGLNKTGGDAAAGTNDTTTRTWGFAIGADHRVTQDTTIGFALAGGELSWGIAQGLGGGKSDVFQAGLYASHQIGPVYVSGMVAYAWYGMRTDRNITFAGPEALRAQFDAHSISGRIEAGYRLPGLWADITPYVAGQVQNFHTPTYSETALSGSGAFALSYTSRNTTATRLELGSWFDKMIALNRDDAILLRGRAAWAHDEGNGGGINAAFQSLPGAGFTVNGAAQPRDLALISAGAEYRLANGVSFSARFDGEFASRAQTYAGTGTVRYVW